MRTPIDTRFPLPPAPGAPDPARGAFKRVLCGVDATRGSFDAVGQAAVLAGPQGELQLVSVADAEGRASLSPSRAEQALAQAARLAGDIGAVASTELVRDRNPTAVLSSMAAEYDLLVVASHGGSRFAGILLGRTATTLIHAPTVPVMLARRLPEGETYPARVVVASDGSPDAGRAIEIGISVGRAYDAHVTLVVARWGIGDRDPDQLVEDTQQLLLDGGIEPETFSPLMDPTAAILEAATEAGASLVVVGSHRLTGLHALGSVSESVAHQAPCSVIIAAA